VAAFLVVAGLLVIPASIVLPISMLPKPVQFMVPGSRDFNLTAPGKYVLWHETETIFQGRTYSGGQLPNGLLMQLSNTASRTIIPLVPDQSTTVRSSGSSRRSIAAFTVTTPGPHVLSVKGQAPQMVFSFGKSEWRNLFWSLGIGFILCPSLVIAGLVLGICVLMRRRSRMNALSRGQASL
jgi:hypothetical protein